MLVKEQTKWGAYVNSVLPLLLFCIVSPPLTLSIGSVTSSETTYNEPNFTISLTDMTKVSSAFHQSNKETRLFEDLL